jgi:hypothetical protein
METTIPMGMTIVSTDEIITPKSPENFIYIINCLNLTPIELIPTAFIIGGACCKMKRITAFHRSQLESHSSAFLKLPGKF